MTRGAYYADARVLVLTSRRDALPLTLLEAMTSGVICVAPRGGNVPDRFADGLRYDILQFDPVPSEYMAANNLTEYGTGVCVVLLKVVLLVSITNQCNCSSSPVVDVQWASGRVPPASLTVPKVVTNRRRERGGSGGPAEKGGESGQSDSSKSASSRWWWALRRCSWNVEGEMPMTEAISSAVLARGHS